MASVLSIWIIGNKIKNALCSQITNVANELKIHIGISEVHIKTISDTTQKLDEIIRKNNLKE